MRSALLALLIGLVAGPVSGQTISPPIRVYVWTATPEIVGLDQQGREDSVADLQKVLKKELTPVASKAESEIQVEVLKRDLEETGAMQRVRGGLVPVSVNALHVAITFGEYRTELTCANYMDGSWRGAAKLCAYHLGVWARRNLKQIRPDGQQH